MLSALFRPHRVAVVGASADPGKVGGTVMANLDGYAGEVVPVTPSSTRVLGRRAYPRLTDMPDPVDLAVVAVPADAVPDVARDAASAGIPAMVVVSGGFAETGAEGVARQERLRDEAEPVRILGPNCLGVIDCHSGLNASIAAGTPPVAGPVSLVTQSGALGMATTTVGAEQHLGFAKICSVGNKVDISDAELLAALGDDRDTGVVCVYLESTSEGRDLVERVGAVSSQKPVIVAKVARSSAGARAARSHTATVAGRSDVWGDLLRSSGAVVARSGRQMLDVARAVATQPTPPGPRVGIVTNSGGLGVELTDLLDDHDLAVPELADPPRKLTARLPAHATASNPVDITPVWDRFSDLYPTAIDALADSGTVDAVVAVLVHRAALDPDVASAIAVAEQRRATADRVPLYVCWAAPGEARETLGELERAGVPCFEWPDRAAEAVAGAHRAGRARRRTDGQPVPPTRPPDLPDLTAPDLTGDSEVLSPAVAERVLRSLGLAVVTGEVCATPRDAVEAARRIGFPVVAKAVGPVHKTDVGGVRTRLGSADAVRRAARELRELGNGILVQRQREGVEIAVGGFRHPDLGAVVMVGRGGLAVEVHRDVAFRQAPTTRTRALKAIRSLRTFPLLEGFRGAPAADLDALAFCVVAVGRLLATVPTVAEVDLNPVFAEPDAATVADARILVGGSGEG